MADLIQSWLRRNARVVNVAPPVSGGWAAVLPRDATRYALLLSADASAVVFWRLGEAPPSVSTAFLPANSPGVMLTEDTVGGAITWPLFLAASAPVAGLPITSLHYQAREFGIYEEMMREFLSKRQSS